MQHCWHIRLYYFNKGKNATETQKERCVQCVEKVLGLIKRVKVVGEVCAGDVSLIDAPRSVNQLRVIKLKC